MTFYNSFFFLRNNKGFKYPIGAQYGAVWMTPSRSNNCTLFRLSCVKIHSCLLIQGITATISTLHHVAGSASSAGAHTPESTPLGLPGILVDVEHLLCTFFSSCKALITSASTWWLWIGRVCVSICTCWQIYKPPPVFSFTPDTSAWSLIIQKPNYLKEIWIKNE